MITLLLKLFFDWIFKKCVYKNWKFIGKLSLTCTVCAIFIILESRRILILDESVWFVRDNKQKLLLATTIISNIMTEFIKMKMC